MRITRMLGIKKSERGKRKGQTGKSERAREDEWLPKGWRRRVGRSKFTFYEALFFEIKCPLSVLCLCITCAGPWDNHHYFILELLSSSKIRFKYRYCIANRQLIRSFYPYYTEFYNIILWKLLHF